MNISQTALDRLNGRLALLLAAAAVLLVVLVGWFVLVSPKRSQAADLESNIANAEAQVSDTQHFLHSSAGRKSVAELAKVNRAMPTDPRVSEIVRQISKASRLAGVRVTGITPGALVSAPGGQAIPFTVLAEGHYFKLQKFVRLLRSATVVGPNTLHVSGRLFAIDSINFSSGQPNAPGATGSGGKLINATLAVDAFASSPGQAGTSSTSTTASATSASTTSP